MSISDEKVAELGKIAKKLHYDIVMMIGAGKPGHLGGSCSIAEIVAALYFYKMRHDPANLEWPDRDRLLLSKGHAALTQYACPRILPQKKALALHRSARPTPKNMY